MARRAMVGLVTVVMLMVVGSLMAQPPSLARPVPSTVGRVPVADVLRRLGAKLEQGAATKESDDYASHFNRLDINRDGRHTRAEYVEKGSYMTPQARAGIFRAADGNADGIVTKAEYVWNRIITDEAKAIVQGMDDDKDGLVERAEFVEHAAKLLSDPKLARQVYAALDTNADGGIPMPEYLRVWGQWARVGRKSAEQRLAVRQVEFTDFASRPGQQPDRPRGPRGMGQFMESKPALAKTDFEKKVLAVLDDMDRNQRRGNMNVPIQDGRLLRLLAETIGAKHIVEFGTSNGYSGIWQCLALKTTGGRLTTFEIDARRAAMARENFTKAGVGDLVTLIEGDAHEKVVEVKGPVDMVFLDADKEGYVDYLNKLLPKVRPGGLIIAHNMNARQADPRFVEVITTNPDLETIFLNGVGLTLKKRSLP